MNRTFKHLNLSLFTLSLLACGSTHTHVRPEVEPQRATFEASAGAHSADHTTHQSPYVASKKLSYPSYTLQKKYVEEQSLGVKYFTSEERNPLRVTVKSGLLHDAQGKVLDPELDKPQNSTRNGKAIYVISQDGRIWVCFDQRYGLIHHSSLLAGAPVLAAGEMVIDQGQLLSISNSSGHYKPAASSIDVAIHILSRLKVDLSQIKRIEVGPTGLPVNRRLRPLKNRSPESRQ